MFDYRKTVLALVILAFSGQGPVYGNEHGGDGTSEAVAEKAATASGDDGKPPPTEDKAKKKKSKDPNRGRFLPIPIFITEPAVGEGFGLALAYFHRKKELPQERKLASPYSIAHASDEQAPPPTVTGILGAVTNNGPRPGGCQFDVLPAGLSLQVQPQGQTCFPGDTLPDGRQQIVPWYWPVLP
jgi:hypothetical protein